VQRKKKISDFIESTTTTTTTITTNHEINEKDRHSQKLSTTPPRTTTTPTPTPKMVIENSKKSSIGEILCKVTKDDVLFHELIGNGATASVKRVSFMGLTMVLGFLDNNDNQSNNIFLLCRRVKYFPFKDWMST
jgi:hypothetical protein